MSMPMSEGNSPPDAGGGPLRPQPPRSSARQTASTATAVEAPERELAEDGAGGSIKPPRPPRSPAANSGAPARVPASNKPSARRRVQVLLLLLLLALLVGDLIVYKPWQTPQAAPSRQPAPLPLADVNPIGTSVFMHKEVDSIKKDKTVSLLYEGKFAWIKQQFPWPEIEINGPGDFYDKKNDKSAWSKFDDIVQRSTRAGLHIIARLDRAPQWAITPGDPDYAPPRDPQLYAAFVSAFVTRYKGKIQAIQIWNEPNLQDEWLGPGKPVDPARYAALLKAAYLAAKKIDPNIIVLSAPLATTNEEGGNLRETIYLQRMYDALARMYNPANTSDCDKCFDVLSANAFGLEFPPENPPDPQVLNFRRVELSRQVMERNGDEAKPVWFTEYGWNAAPANLSADQLKLWRHVSQVEQADYTVRGIQYARENWPWAGVFTIWFFRQVGDMSPSQAEYYFGMVTPEFVPEPVYYSVQSLATSLATAGPGSYGAWSAPVHSDANWNTAVIKGEDGATLTPILVSNGTTGTLTLSFEGTDVDLDLPAALPAGAGRLYVTVDGGDEGIVAALPRDEAGRAYLDAATLAEQQSKAGAKLAAPADAGTSLALVQNLGREYAPVIHQLQLRASAAGVQIAGFKVRSERSLTEFWLVTALLLAGLAANIVLLRRWRVR